MRSNRPSATKRNDADPYTNPLDLLNLLFEVIDTFVRKIRAQ
jgi:hypothetical protein